jgi:hypothetical protein
METVRIRDPGWVKIRTRNKHPGSATLFRPRCYSKPIRPTSPVAVAHAVGSIVTTLLFAVGGDARPILLPRPGGGGQGGEGEAGGRRGCQV